MHGSLTEQPASLPPIRRTDAGGGSFRPQGTRGFVGVQIRTARRLAGVSRADLAARLGIEKLTLASYEHGTGEMPALLIARLAEAMEKPLAWFFCLASNENNGAGLAAQSRAPADPRLRVLLVDDAPDVLLILGAFLEGAGLQVVRAGSGDEALRILAAATPLHVLVTDSVMPGMSGVDLLLQASQLRPSLPGLLITGYAETLARGVDLPPGVAVLRKPFRREELVARVQGLACPAATTVVQRGEATAG